MMPMMAQRLIPPVPYYKTGFEEMEAQTFVDDTVEIEGVRWRIVNGRIVDDPKANIPFGKKALELTAGYVGDVPAMIEALDPIRGTQVSVSYMQGWTDALVSNAGKSWFAQESFDGGKNWLEKELIFDATTISTDLYERIDPDADSFRFRIIFNDPDKTKGVGWRIMLDNIAFYDTGEGAPIRTPWSVYPADIRNGFETAQSTLSYHILAFGDDWIMGDPQAEPGFFTSYIEARLDDQPATQHWRLNSVDSLITYSNLQPGVHTIGLRFMDIATGQPYPELEEHVTYFTVKESTQLHSLEELLQAPVGGFYEVTFDKKTLVNMAVPMTPEKWLWDGKKGIMMFDPRLHDPIYGNPPEKALLAKRIVGQLVERDHNLYFQVDAPSTLEEVDQPFMFDNRTTKSIQDLLDNADYNMYAPVSIQNVRIKRRTDSKVPYRFGALDEITITDSTGVSMKMQNFFPFLFLANKEVDPSGDLTVFGMMAKHRTTGEPVLWPLFALNYQSTANEPVLASPSDLRVATEEGVTRFTAEQPVSLYVWDMAGTQLYASTATATEHVVSVEGSVLVAATFEDGRVWIQKLYL